MNKQAMIEFLEKAYYEVSAIGAEAKLAENWDLAKQAFEQAGSLADSLAIAYGKVAA